jgi:hypothetical protein
VGNDVKGSGNKFRAGGADDFTCGGRFLYEPGEELNNSFIVQENVNR